MRLVDARRLTGPNLFSPHPQVLVELALEPGEVLERVAEVYLEELGRMRGACGWPASVEPALRSYLGGGMVAFAGPIDTLLASAEMADWAARSAAERLAGREPLPLEPEQAELAAMIDAQRSPALLALQAEAARRGLPFLWDDEAVTVGEGRRSRTWPRGELPSPEQVVWEGLGSIPVVLITGTNGKTTCSRWVARVAREAGLCVGATSTEGILVDGEVVEEGDTTGPVSARRVLRDERVELAVLETARGGIMRRGLAVEVAAGALLTNVSADHLGDYGIQDVPTMARVKSVIGRVVHSRGRVVLNARDEHLVALAPTFAAPVVYFSRDAESEVVRAHRARGGEAWVLREGWLVQVAGQSELPLVRVEDIPLTFGGAAVHNVENALAVAALASAVGLKREAIVAGLTGMRGSEDNPGRGNLVEVAGVKVLVDFGHNPAAVHAVLGLVDSLRGGQGRLAVITGHAGDRLDEDIANVAHAIGEHGPELVLLRELEGYLRGRQPGEVPERFRQAFLERGMAAEHIHVVSGEVEALQRALEWARPGDFVVLLVHIESESVHQWLREQGARVLA